MTKLQDELKKKRPFESPEQEAALNILGSFFPAWLICIVVGVVLTVLTRQVFVATGIAPDVGPAALVYPCLAGVWIFATWLLVFAG